MFVPGGLSQLARRRALPPPRLLAADSDATTSSVYFKIGAANIYQARFSTLRIFDLNLNLVGKIGDATNLSSAGDCETTDDETFAFVSAETGTNGMCVSSYNITNKASPTFVQRMRGPTPGTSLAGATCIKKDSGAKLLFVSTITRNSVAIISFDPATGMMTWVAEFRGAVPGTSLRSCRRISLDTVNKVCFWVCDNNSGGTARMGAFSYADPANPIELWSAAPGEADGARGVYWVPQRRLLFVNANGPSPFYGMLTAYEVPDTTVARFPRKAGSFIAAGRSVNSNRETASGTRSTAFRQVGSRHYACMTAESGFNIIMLDVTNPARMFKVGQRWDQTLLNAPMESQFGPDGSLYTGSFTTAGAQNIAKWAVDLAA